MLHDVKYCDKTIRITLQSFEWLYGRKVLLDAFVNQYHLHVLCNHANNNKYYFATIDNYYIANHFY